MTSCQVVVRISYGSVGCRFQVMRWTCYVMYRLGLIPLCIMHTVTPLKGMKLQLDIVHFSTNPGICPTRSTGGQKKNPEENVTVKSPKAKILMILLRLCGFHRTVNQWRVCSCVTLSHQKADNGPESVLSKPLFGLIPHTVL